MIGHLMFEDKIGGYHSVSRVYGPSSNMRRVDLRKDQMIKSHATNVKEGFYSVLSFP